MSKTYHHTKCGCMCSFITFEAYYIRETSPHTQKHALCCTASTIQIHNLKWQIDSSRYQNLKPHEHCASDKFLVSLFTALPHPGRGHLVTMSLKINYNKYDTCHLTFGLSSTNDFITNAWYLLYTIFPTRFLIRLSLILPLHCRITSS